MNGYVTIVQLLIQHGADVRANDDETVREAANNGHDDVVALLLQHGAVLPAEPVEEDEDEKNEEEAEEEQDESLATDTAVASLCDAPSP